MGPLYAASSFQSDCHPKAPIPEGAHAFIFIHRYVVLLMTYLLPHMLSE